MATNFPKRAIELHNEMMNYIVRELSLHVHEIKWLFEHIPLSTNRCSEISSPRELLNDLMKSGEISIGEYSNLIPKLDIVKPEIVTYVNNMTKKIRKVLDEASTPLDEGMRTMNPAETEAGIPLDENQTTDKAEERIPTEVSQEKTNNYKSSMKESAKTQNINLTFIGHAGAGKTCLMRQLLRKPIKIGGPDRTNLAELLTKRLRYKLGMSAKEREKLEKGKEAELCRRRLRRLRKRREDKNLTTIYQRNDPTSTVDMGGTEYETDSSEDREDDLPPIMSGENASQMTDDQIKAIEDINKDDDIIDDASVAYVTLFDFGGDEVFRNCLHCIMTANSIYLLVFDVSLFVNERKQDYVIDEIVFWSHLVATYAKDDSHKDQPPVILIGSHMDNVTENEKYLSEQIWAKLKEKPGMEAILDNHVQEILFLADMNKNDDQNKEQYLHVWREIEKCVHLQSCWHDIITGTWLALEEKLMLEKEKGIKFLTMKQVLDINSEMLVPLKENDLVQFLRHLHNAGSLFCFSIVGKTDSESLTEQEMEQINVILDINWIVQAFGAIITDDKFVTIKSNKKRLMWKEYKETAKLTDKVVDFRWNNLPSKYRQVLLTEMKNLGLITEPGNVSKSPNPRKEQQNYVVPCLLGKVEPEFIQELLNNRSVYCTKTLCLVFKHQFIPQAVWDKTTAFCIHEFGEFTNIETGSKKRKTDYFCPKRGFICRNFDGVWNFVLHCKGAMLKLTMFTHHKPSSTHGIGQILRRRIEEILKSVLAMTNQGHRIYSYFIHCDFLISDGELHHGKANEETWKNLNEYTAVDASGNTCSLTPDDWKTWFKEDFDKSPTQTDHKENHQVPPTDMKKEIHAEIVRELGKWIYPNSEQRWTTFQVELGLYLPPVDLYDVPDNSVAKICDKLMAKGTIKYGDYSILRDIVDRIDVRAADVIDKAMKKLPIYRS